MRYRIRVKSPVHGTFTVPWDGVEKGDFLFLVRPDGHYVSVKKSECKISEIHPRLPARACGECGVSYTPGRSDSVTCAALACRKARKRRMLANRVATDEGTDAEEETHRGRVGIACEDCAHATPSVTSTSGWICGSNALVCRPYGDARLWVAK